MKTSLVRWGWALFSVAALVIALYITVVYSLPYYTRMVEDLGFWAAVLSIFGHWTVIVAPFLLIGIGVRAYKSVRYTARKNGKGENL